MYASQQPSTYSYPPGVTLGPSAGLPLGQSVICPELPLFQTVHPQFHFVPSKSNFILSFISGSPVQQAFGPASANLGSNNPFRNRALSPSASSFASASGQSERRTSTNPFEEDSFSPQSAPVVGTTMASQDMSSNTRELFENLSINPAPQNTGYRQAPPRPEKPAQNGYPNNRVPPPRERPERREKDSLDIFADPPKTSNGARSGQRDRRPRRNSESSIMERTPKPVDTEEERRRRERRRREREREGRHKDGKDGKDAKDGKHRSKKSNYHMDIIDKLDVTSIYGTGMFHHDGPFDACNPNRNRKGVRTAPMQAFPKDSANMALGGSGPNNSDIDHNLFHGRTEQGYNDFAASAAADPRRNENPNFDPTARIEPIHGTESMGLGTSTFLEGAPASRADIQRRGSGPDGLNGGGGPSGGGLQRKKSLAQRLRGMNKPSSGRVVSPEGSYTPAVPTGSGHIGTIRANEKNPFFQDYDDAWDKKGAQINMSEEARGTGGARARSSSSPKQPTGLERRFTNERSYTGFEEGKSSGGGGGGGFINRMKSLRKPRPERRISND
ncbi:Pal1-domain-containing protein [Aspergillus sclerotiicarbonarius CBS 121057]|uniref:Pal1-domain-containing protein n=1 Tax=Aspergillus sclerotiicarbonarius (strain CBS 121057 / IBT 28362) TaxID=1448318 RepID=A0A319FJJ6_ASPSB|nr:Pal1-domain-containing protein [Aspergillus sclerotiicarbonarius CBS 121057]